MFDARRLSLWLPALLVLAGCGTPLRHVESPLKPPQMSPDSVVLEMFFVRFPQDDAAAKDKIWDEIDEQQFTPELRDRLTRSGFRAGVVSGPMPVELSKLLELSGKTAAAEGIAETKVQELESQPRVLRRHLQLRAGKRAEIIASCVYPELPLLTSESGRVCGETYCNAKGIFAARPLPQPDGRIRLELVPELHHGQPRPRWVGGPGLARLDASQPKREFYDLTIAADLTPGAMLVLSGLTSRPGSLGHYFFTENDGRPQQKMLIVRLAQTQQDGLFNPPEPLELEEE